jgi:ATP-dependent protease ClpP protease subunit
MAILDAMRRHLPLNVLVLALLAPPACHRVPEHATGRLLRNGELGLAADGGAVSTAQVTIESAAGTVDLPSLTQPRVIDWSPLQLSHGKASLSCDLEYPENSEERPISDFSDAGLRETLAPCAEHDVIRVRYQGKIDSDFTSLIERVTTITDELQIGKRVLDLHSAGGMIEDAIRAGDFVAESRWNIWVREGSICHSACVLILSAGDKRMIAGQVGIHRIIRMSSTATTRAELNQELHVVYGRVRDYLERNGAAVAVADLMRAVPNRSLRLLSSDELRLYGLDGVNPAQDDLDRVRLRRECGGDFLGRRDAFERAFERRCRIADVGVDELNACGLALREGFGFPDQTCPAESPFAEFDTPDAAFGSSSTAHSAVDADGGDTPAPSEAA